MTCFFVPVNVDIVLLRISTFRLTWIGMVEICIKLIVKTIFVILINLYYAVYNMFLLQKGVN